YKTTGPCTSIIVLISKLFYRERGLVSMVVDMRWGVRDVVAVDHKTTELCIKEIESCQRMSVGPTFIALVGNRYGYRPIPRLIEHQEFEVLSSQLMCDESACELLHDWFWKDENAVPPVYILQPITSHLPHYDDKTLARLLRAAASEAEKEGLISKEQKHVYFKSVTEWEIECGLLSGREEEVNCVVFLREVEDLQEHIKEETSSQFVDIKADGEIDMEAQELLSELKSKISSNLSKRLKVHTVQWRSDIARRKQKGYSKYLTSLCEQFVMEIKEQILSRVLPCNESDDEMAGVIQELCHHMALCAKKCTVFCGRRDFLVSICESIKQSDASLHAPLVVFGPSGTGKTALVCKLSQEVRTILGENTVVVLRLLGTSPLSSEIHSVLKSVCLQICFACGLSAPPAQVTNIYNDLVCFFHNLLAKVSEKNEKSLVLILDSLDQLSPADGAHRLYWLPKECPPKVHIIISTLPFEYGILHTLQGVIAGSRCYYEVKSLSGEQGGEMLEMLMASVKRKLTPAQRSLILESFEQCGQPLLLKLAFEEARRWASYTPLTELQVAMTTQSAIQHLYGRLEKQHGRTLVSHALGYIVSSKNGLSEAELKDVLSLDDEVLGDIYQYWPPPSSDVIHLPPLLWTRLRYDLGDYLVERQADGFTVLGLYHRQFIEAVQECYLSEEDKARRHSVLADFFKGTWSQGVRKPITLPSLNRSLNADRKVAAQPLWFSDKVANVRKLSELPYHLLHAGRIEELKKEILGRMDWLVCRALNCGIKSVIGDLNLCSECIDCSEVQLVRDTFLLLKPTVDFIEGEENIFYYEVPARLEFFSSSYPTLIGKLCCQCRDWCSMCQTPALVPACGFFQPPGGPLQTTLTGFKKGVTVLELSPDRSLLVAGSQDGRMMVWSLKDIEVIHILTGHSAGEVRCVQVINEGTRAVSGSSDHSLRLWNLLTGKEVYSIQEDHAGYEVFALLQVETKKEMIYSVSGSQVNVWHLETAEPLFHISGGSPDVRMCMAVLGPGLPLISVSEGGLLSLWDSTTGERQGIHCLDGMSDAAPACIAVLKNQGRIAVGNTNGIALISPEGRCMMETLSSPATFLVVSEDEMLLAAGFEKFIRIFKTQPNLLSRSSCPDLDHGDAVETASFSSDQSMLMTGSQDEIIRVWSLVKGLLLVSLDGMGVPVTALVLAGSTLVSASRSAYYLKVWNLDYNKKNKSVTPFQDRTGLAAISHEGELVYFPKTGDKEKILVWNSLEGKTVDTLDASREVTCLEVAEMKKLLFCGLLSGTVLVFPVNFRQDTMCIPPRKSLGPTCCIGISKQEEKLAVAYENSICVFDINPGRHYSVIDGPIYEFSTWGPSAISSVAVLASYRVLYGMENGELCSHECKTSKVVSLDAHDSKVTCIAISNSERYALSGSQDTIQRLWNLDLSQWDHEMDYKVKFSNGILCAAFSHDDRYVFTGSQDRALKVWDISNGSLLMVQYVYATINRIVATPEGLIATTRLGYVIREKFHCPDYISAQYNPLQNIKATYSVKSRKGAGDAPMSPAVPRNNSETASPRKDYKKQSLKSSQMCLLV
uniref:NACHT and WD repeat domain containing 1 n=1 Tax=Latimeria chalumnae TaxID=7897 RepID=H3BFE0_LATCH